MRVNLPNLGLGFGLMRLPTLEDKSIDVEQVNRMVDRFIGAGFTYFDAAYGYLGGLCESIAGEAVVARYPRDKFVLATKLPPWEVKTPEDPERLFRIQLERTGAGYFDYYLLHAVVADRLPDLDANRVWEFLRRVKDEGRARHIGISFHDKADVLDGILAAHPELEFVQLQINYADWDSDSVQSRLCYEVARKHGCAVIVMEPVKGGSLAVLPEPAREALKAARPDATPAAWAMRFAASLDGIVTVLSGMSTLEQVEDNARTMGRFEPLTDADRAVIGRVREIIASMPTIPCTDCRYCVEKCPVNIPIPRILRIENEHRLYGFANRNGYQFATRGAGKASDCVRCGVCESRCPQGIAIPDILSDCAKSFER